MTQKNCENEIRELSRDQQEMLDEHIDRLNKVFKGKDNYVGIAVMSEKYAPVVRENKEAYPLNEIQVIHRSHWAKSSQSQCYLPERGTSASSGGF